jgi:putative YjhG/YagF family dehydratase
MELLSMATHRPITRGHDTTEVTLDDVIGENVTAEVMTFTTAADGPEGSVPFTGEMLIEEPSGNIFGFSQNAAMGWEPSQLLRKQFLILSTAGGVRGHDGKPIALGFHTGHFELSIAVEAAANELKALKAVPFAAFCTDPCDGRTQGTTGMMDSLAYRNDAATVLRRQARSLPTSRGVLGIATCDKGLPAMMMALAGLGDSAGVIMPGGTTMLPNDGEDAGQIQSIGARYSQGEITLEYAQDVGCRACASPGGGCQFFGTAGTSQAMVEALGLALTHTALAPSGTPIWLDNARRTAKALVAMERSGTMVSDILSDEAFENALMVHAASGGSTNLLLHMPAIAHAAGRRRMTSDDWNRINKQVPRLVDVLPNGPVGHPTSRFFAAGGIPEVMLHLRKLGLLHLDVKTATGRTLGENLEWWEQSDRRRLSREHLQNVDGVDPDNVIMEPDKARSRGLTSTVTFPYGNLAPEGSVIKSTAIDPTVLDDDGVYRKVGPARVFRTEAAAIRAIKSRDDNKIKSGDVMVVSCAGPLGSGMEELFQVTVALRYLSYGKHVTLLTDGRFSGVSTGACIGHIGPEALSDGPIGRVREGDQVQVIIDTINLTGTIDLIGDADTTHDAEWGTAELERRGRPDDLAPHPLLPDDTRLWAALQEASGGTWGGCVFDVDEIVGVLRDGLAARA